MGQGFLVSWKKTEKKKESPFSSGLYSSLESLSQLMVYFLFSHRVNQLSLYVAHQFLISFLNSSYRNLFLMHNNNRRRTSLSHAPLSKENISRGNKTEINSIKKGISVWISEYIENTSKQYTQSNLETDTHIICLDNIRSLHLLYHIILQEMVLVSQIKREQQQRYNNIYIFFSIEKYQREKTAPQSTIWESLPPVKGAVREECQQSEAPFGLNDTIYSAICASYY